MDATAEQIFENADRTADRLGVPAGWLKAEAKAGRLPYLRVGSRMLFHLDTVKKALIERAQRDEA